MQHQAKKRFGQNFLRDKNLLKKIVNESNILNKDVIEVGPGQGALTSFLAQQAHKLICFEIDTSLKPILDPIEQAYENTQIIYQDFMTSDISIYGNELHVVANVPYYITTPIIFKLVETKQIKTASLMIQKEVCERLIAKPGSKTYNNLSVVMSYYGNVYKMMDVKRHMFVPQPNVDSAVIRIEKRDKPLLEPNAEKVFLSIVRSAFKQKRKTLVNNWFEAYQIDKTEIQSFLESFNIDPNIRAEKVTINQFMDMAGAWSYDL
ncbi:MAG: 16S rRNA (adenine(1518)-N(6)/adenine(1519)-N(6))-dimethyltransferase RsmA [Acholeplasmataceae bacterium]|nr:16S rRNA (adenine(1518)-N(6)/adenine(1519)-N(6))-dimethyltransferase RsmA [Acholeplasmataceae bacterium]